MSDFDTFNITQKDRSKGGKERAKKLSPQRRKEIATKASHSRKCIKDLPKATHSGDLIIGDTKIACAVLEDGRRVITESSMFEILGRARRSRKKDRGGTDLPAFLGANNIKPFINNNLRGWTGTIQFFSPKYGKAYGYEAEVIPGICKIYLDARRAGVLTSQQYPTANKAEIILHSLAKVGIISLIDEATNFQQERENNELQKLFKKFIAKELQPWTQRFPHEFFENIKRWYGLEHLKGNPSFIGCFINKYIYEEISPEILDELKARNPTIEKGYRRNRHHQFLTPDVGHPTLEKQILKINTLMSVTDSKEEFDKLYDKTKS